MLPPEPSKPKPDLSRAINWLRVGKIYAFKSGIVFREIRPPRTPLLVPLLYVSIASAMILCIILPFIWDSFGFGSETSDSMQRPDIVSQVGAIATNAIFQVPIEVFTYTIAMILLGTYYFGIARFFRIDDIWWEHWFAFAWWTHVPLISLFGAVEFMEAYSGAVDPSFGVSLVVVGLCFLLPIAWTVSLSVQGLRSWTGKGWTFCLGVSAPPYLLVLLDSTQNIIEVFARALA